MTLEERLVQLTCRTFDLTRDHASRLVRQGKITVSENGKVVTWGDKNRIAK